MCEKHTLIGGEKWKCKSFAMRCKDLVLTFFTRFQLPNYSIKDRHYSHQPSYDYMIFISFVCSLSLFAGISGRQYHTNTLMNL